MKRVTIAGISLIIFIISLFVLYFFPHIDGEAVKYVMTENGPKFKELEGKLYDVEEYKEGHYYLVDDNEIIVETTIQEWKKSRMLCILSLVIRLVAIASILVFSLLGFFYPMLKTLSTKKNYLFPR
ncbi:MAG: hypothetical protein J5857_04270 [Treponema sp.]|nr:hypothetical protein [Treponema sp.]